MGLDGLINGSKMDPVAVMGIYDVPIHKNIIFDGEDTLVYCAGRSVVRLNIHERVFNCVLREKPSNVTCLNLIPRKDETLVLIGESLNEANPVLYI